MMNVEVKLRNSIFLVRYSIFIFKNLKYLCLAFLMALNNARQKRRRERIANQEKRLLNYQTWGLQDPDDRSSIRNPGG